jgi:hypothetical protein
MSSVRPVAHCQPPGLSAAVQGPGTSGLESSGWPRAHHPGGLDATSATVPPYTATTSAPGHQELRQGSQAEGHPCTTAGPRVMLPVQLLNTWAAPLSALLLARLQPPHRGRATGSMLGWSCHPGQCRHRTRPRSSTTEVEGREGGGEGSEARSGGSTRGCKASSRPSDPSYPTTPT